MKSSLSNQDKTDLKQADEKSELINNDGDDIFGHLEYKAEKPTLLQYSMIPLSFIVYFVFFGFTNNIGTIKVHWEHTTKKSAFLDQAGSINFALFYLMSILATLLVKNIGYGPTYMIGCMISCVSFALMSYINNHICIFICYGILLGVGGSLILFSILFLVADVFADNLPVVNGIIVCGSCLGTMIQSLFLNKLLDLYGWNILFRAFSGLIFICMFFGVLFHFGTKKNKPNLVKKTQKCDTNAIYGAIYNNLKFVILCLGCFLFTIGYLVPFFYFKVYAESKQIAPNQATTMIGYYSIGSLFGRLLFGFGANFVGNYKIFLLIISFFFMGCANILSRFCCGFMTFLVYSIVLGFFEGGFISLVVPVINEVFVDSLKSFDADAGKQILNLAITINFMIQSVGMLVGPIISSYMISQSVSYDNVFLFSGALFIASSLVVAVNRFIPTKNYLKQYLI